MGLFDTVVIDKLFCIYCGASIDNHEWQTKDTECILETFDSTDELFERYPEVGYFSVIGDCDNCEQFIRFELQNTSLKHREFLDEQMKEMQLRWRREAFDEHPNHGDAHWHKIWCAKCPKDEDDETSGK